MAEPETSPLLSAIPLAEIPLTEGLFQGMNDDGELLLRQSVIRPVRGSRGFLPERSLVALALTEVCCRIGRGKVVNFHSLHCVCDANVWPYYLGLLLPYAG